MGNEVMSAGQLLKQANQLKRAGRLDEAIDLYHRVIKINPNFAWAYNNLGDAFFKQGNSDEAIVKYCRAIEINPNSAWFYINLGSLLIQQGAFQEAIGYFRQGIKNNPDLLYEFNSKYFQLFHSIFKNKYCNFCLSENEDLIKLTKEPIWITLPVEPFTNYYLIGRSSSPQPPTNNQALVQVEFLDENKGLIPSPYSGIPHSQIIGPYFYIYTSGEVLSEFKTNSFKTTSLTHYLRLGFINWHNKKPIILDSKLRLEFDLLVPLLENINQNVNSKALSEVGVNPDPIQNVDEAVSLLFQVKNILPNSCGVYETLGNIFLGKGQLSRAIAAFRKCCLINSSYVFPYENLRGLYDVNNLNNWAISEELFLYILETLPVGSTILEFGSGTGTLELSKHYNLVSIEHDKKWFNKYDSRYIYAPLVDDMWYDGEVLSRELGGIDYDLILIDGPPQHRRKGILNYLDLFNWNVPVIVDDINRQYDMDVAISLAKYLGKIPRVYKYNKYFAVID
jgi:tetratricopeptide (TPR) repeat protein